VRRGPAASWSASPLLPDTFAVSHPPSTVSSPFASRYVIERELGRGATAIVYLARDLAQGRMVAIKMLRHELVSSVGAELFLREIRLLAGLQHPHIVPVLDSGEANGTLYCVLPFMDGGTMRDRLRRDKQLPLADVIAIGRAMAGALGAAHAKGLVHRDVKPENILFTSGQACLADFGIARALVKASGDSTTSTGIVRGTPAYMSPEQASGERDYDGRSDIYSLACVLYEAIAGVAAFVGATSQSVVAQRLSHMPRPLHVYRPKVPAGLEQVLEHALATAPADRYQTAEEFAAALANPSVAMPRPRARARAAVVGGALVLAAAVAWLWQVIPSEALDSRKVVVYPLRQLGATRDRTEGEAIALMIGSALEHTEPLKWIYGWTWLDSSRRADISLLDQRFARRLARARGAKYFVDGSVFDHNDSVSVVLRLVDSEGDSVIAQATAAGASDHAALVALHAVNELLPRILDPGRKVNLDMLAGVRPGSAAAWLQGEREFRRSHFTTALDYYRKALAEDSGMTLAAVKGAEAAWWANQDAEARRLADIAALGESRLPSKYAHMARGLQAFLSGSADLAVHHLELAVEQDSIWAEGWMMLGDAYYHLVPARSRPDSAAEVAFVTSQRLDPEFSPPLFHLAEFALRRRQGGMARQLTAEFQHSAPDSAMLQKLDLMNNCVERGARAVDWAEAARRHPDVVVQAAKAFSAGGANFPCAEGGFRAAYVSDGAALNTRWGALLGLEYLLIAEGRTRDAGEVLNSASSRGMRPARVLYAVSTAAGIPMDSLAASIAREWGVAYAGMSVARIWHQGLWAIRVKDTLGLRAMIDALQRGTDTSVAARSVASGFEARLLLARGDSSGAIARLEQLRPFGPAADITWGLWQPQAFERLLLAELLFARRRFRDAIRVASEFDHPQPILYVACLPRSLQLRYRAAVALGETADADQYATRLRSLGRRDLTATTPP